MENKSKCLCKESTCADDCKRNHTHKTFWCERCHPERYTPTTDEGKELPYPCSPLSQDQTFSTPPESWEDRFDKQFGTDGPEKDSDSIGRNAGCDDCSENIKQRAEYKQFISQTLATEKARWMKEWGEKIEGLLPENTTDVTTYGWLKIALLKTLNPSEQEER